MLPVEVKHSNGAFYKASVCNITPDGALIQYENNWKPQQTVPFGDLRHPGGSSADSTSPESIDYQPGDDVEAFMSPKESEPSPAWWKARVKRRKETFFVIECLLPDRTSTQDVLPADQIRKPNTSQPLTRNSFFTFDYDCTDKRILDLLSDEAIHSDFYAKVGPCVIVPNENKITAIALDSTVMKKVKLLFEMHFRFLRLRAEITSDIEAANYKLEQSKITGSSNLTEKFTIKQEFVGLAIGSRGMNITEARKIDGVVNIELHPLPSDPTLYEVTITGTNRDAMERAREMVEYVEESVLVPEALISRVIGKNGKMLQEVVDKTQVIKIRIEDNHDNQGELKGLVPLWIIGNREAFNNARMLIEYQVTSLQDLEEVKDKRDQLNIQLHTVGVPGVSRGGPYRGGGLPVGRGGGGYGMFRGGFDGPPPPPRRGGGFPQHGYSDGPPPFQGGRGGFRRGGPPGPRGGRFGQSPSSRGDEFEQRAPPPPGRGGGNRDFGDFQQAFNDNRFDDRDPRSHQNGAVRGGRNQPAHEDGGHFDREAPPSGPRGGRGGGRGGRGGGGGDQRGGIPPRGGGGGPRGGPQGGRGNRGKNSAGADASQNEQQNQPITDEQGDAPPQPRRVNNVRNRKGSGEAGKKRTLGDDNTVVDEEDTSGSKPNRTSDSTPQKQLPNGNAKFSQSKRESGSPATNNVVNGMNN